MRAGGVRLGKSVSHFPELGRVATCQRPARLSWAVAGQVVGGESTDESGGTKQDEVVGAVGGVVGHGLLR